MKNPKWRIDKEVVKEYIESMDIPLIQIITKNKDDLKNNYDEIVEALVAKKIMRKRTLNWKNRKT